MSLPYIYIVTRIMTKLEPGIQNIPNLGVHTSQEKAFNHYMAVVKSRLQNPELHYGKIYPVGDERMQLLAEYNVGDEIIRLEKWIRK